MTSTHAEIVVLKTCTNINSSGLFEQQEDSARNVISAGGLLGERSIEQTEWATRSWCVATYPGCCAPCFFLSSNELRLQTLFQMQFFSESDAPSRVSKVG